MNFKLLSGILVLAALFVLSSHQAGAVINSLNFEPLDGQTYFGFTTRSWDSTDPAYGDTRSFVERYQDSIQVELGGKAPSLFGIPSIWQNADGSMVPFSSSLNQINQYTNLYPNSVPVITWNLQTGWDVSSSDYSGLTTKSLLDGSYDAYITQYALAVKAYNKPVFIRPICGEVNGSWWHNCSPLANPTLTKTDFIYAWQRVVDIFRAQGVTNVAWVWNMNTFPTTSVSWVDADIASYYPGDTYVDWVGADHYDFGSVTYLDPHYNFAVVHNKPFFLAEWGVKHSGSTLSALQQQQWIQDMFNYIASHPKIKASLYFNYNMNGPANEDPAHLTDHIWLYNNTVNYHPSTNNNDHRLVGENGANFRNTFATNIAQSRYISTVLVTVPDITLPLVSITSPLNNSLVSKNSTVTIQATSSDASGISKVEFLVNGVLKCTDTSVPYSCPWLVPNGKNIQYTLQAMAYDTAGNSASSTVKVTSK